MLPKGTPLVLSLVFVFACSSSAEPAGAPPTAPSDGGVDAAPRAPAADPSAWRKTGSLKTARYAHTATLLADGKVLVVGGENLDHVMMASVEIFDPAVEAWSEIASLSEPRSNHAAVLLGDGKVLVIGGGKNAPIGQPLGEAVTASALLFDPATGAFTPVDNMHHARSHFHALRLPSGRVLVAGGGGDAQETPDCSGAAYCGPLAKALASAEIFDPATGKWTEGSPMATARYSFSLTALSSGRVLAAGGVDAQAEGVAASEIYDPDANAWAAGPSLDGPREHHTATLLGTGRVIVAGGKNPNVTPLASIELFDPTAAAWTKGRSMPSPRTLPGLVTLESGRALVVGGFDQLAQGAGKKAYLDEARIYDDDAQSWTKVAPLLVGRLWQTTTLLDDGRVLVAGGIDDSAELASCELAEPASP